jgi:hypothetical protein
MMNATNDQLRNACEAALNSLLKMDMPQQFGDIIAKLQYVIGSYDYDKNPIGLVEIGQKAIPLLNEAKELKPKTVTKKVITDLEKCVAGK